MGARDARSERRGFTLIEVLVALSVIAILITLLIPAIQSAREAGRRIQCSANLRQFGIALRGYHDAFGSLPPGRIKSHDIRFSGPNPPCTSTAIDKSIHIMVLPYLEQMPLYNAINQSTAILSVENLTIHPVSIPTFACPSDPLAGVARAIPAPVLAEFNVSSTSISMTSYAGCLGSLPVVALPLVEHNCVVSAQCVSQSNGVFNDVSPIRFEMVSDGLSGTIFMLERSYSKLTSLDNYYPNYSLLHGWYVTGNWGDTLLTTMYPPNIDTTIAATALQAQTYSGSSLHSSGLNVLFGDGSVRFVANTVQSWTVDPSSGNPIGSSQANDGSWVGLPKEGVWQMMSTRSGAESSQSDSY